MLDPIDRGFRAALKAEVFRAFEEIARARMDEADKPLADAAAHRAIGAHTVAQATLKEVGANPLPEAAKFYEAARNRVDESRTVYVGAEAATLNHR